MSHTDPLAPAEEIAERILAGLDPEQREAVGAVRGPVCVLAGAGTGKTRTITHRIAYAVCTGAVPAGQLLAVTFTARAAGEMRSRLRALGGVGGAELAAVQARTFHAAARRQLRYFAPRVLGGAMPELVDNKIRLMGQAATRCKLDTDRTSLRDLAGEVEWAKSTLVNPEEYPQRVAAADREPPMRVETVSRVYAHYEELKAEAGLMDFEDLLMVTALAIEEHRDVAEQVRARYRHFVVDEYQDVNPLQQRLLDAWLGPRDDLCVVGDANQTIYSFTGATPEYLLDFSRRFPDARVVRLERDYRSTPQVVTLANRLIGAGRGAVGPARLRLVGQREAGPAPSFVEYADEPSEAAGVAAACAKLVASGVPASEIAVLFRANAQSESYERALADLDVPYAVRGGERFFERPEIRQAIGLLRGAARSPVAEPGPLAEEVRDVLAAMGWSALAVPPGGAARERWESLAALVGVAEELAGALPGAGLEEFVAELEQRVAAQHVPTVQGVTLASLHAAKGLEWDAVFLVGLSEGTLPIQYAETDEQVEEERRLLYVGITRAREHLELSWSLTRTPGGRRSRRRSRFLHPLDPGGRADPPRSSSGPQRKAAPSTGPQRCRICGRPVFAVVERKLRRCERCPGDMDEALFARLRDWRKARAAEQRLPDFVIFTDATLVAIAETRPATVAELVSISGIGQRKLDLYGPEVLALVQGEVGEVRVPESPV